MDIDIIDISQMLLLLLVSILTFYFQAVVTEERFVPALNVLSKRLSISDDVVGATLMAAGASAPELFANVVSMFITHGGLGMGTIVGSEIFNQLVMISGAIFAAKNNTLKLDPLVLMRDVGFYALSLFLLCLALMDKREVDYDDVYHVFIPKIYCILLFGSYILYVFVCANFNKWFRPPVDNDEEFLHYEAYESSMSPRERVQVKKQVSLSKINVMPFVRSLVREPMENFHTENGPKSGNAGEVLSATSSIITELYSVPSDTSSVVEKSCNYPSKAGLFLLDHMAPRLIDITEIEDIERIDDHLGLFLWQRSSFYDKAKIDINAWQLRWFVFSQNKVVTLPVRRQVISEDDDMYIFPLIEGFDVDESRLLINVNTHRRDYTFLAPTDTIFLTTKRRLEELLRLPAAAIEYNDEKLDISEVPVSLLQYPRQGTMFKKMFHIFVLPINAMIHFVIPDVRVMEASVAPGGKAIVAAILSVTYLVIGSYVMVISLEGLAHELYIPESVVGATISAAGTSLPNYIASQLAARQGLGNMAISNAFGSSTFNILVGLGLPWLVYTCLNDGYYSELPDEGITESMFVLIFALLIFIVIILTSKFQLTLSHGYLLFSLYVLFVIHYTGQCFFEE